MTGDPACVKPGSETLGEEVIVNPDGTLQNVYLHVVSGLGDRVFAPPPEPAEMDQKGCVFIPHVMAVQANQVIEFHSSDPFMHNVRAAAEKNRTFNVSMPGRGRRVRRYFSTPEVVRMRCDLHAWMQAWIAVSDNPFHDVTGESGAFELVGLPAGTYTIEAWHEVFGASRQTITLSDREQGEIEFTLGE
jgi:plastocyanin